MSRSSEIDALDLIVNRCPLGCNRQCARIWINQNTGHRIICKCKCRHKNQAGVRGCGTSY